MEVGSDLDAMMAQAQNQRGRGETTVPDKCVQSFYSTYTKFTDQQH